MQIGSTNPKFSFILKKNPSSGPLVRNLRDGHLFGYYSDDNKIFNCFFKDSDSEISYKRFKDDMFEYVNPSRYNAPEFVLDSVSTFLEHIIKKENEFDIEGYDNFLMINMINIKRKYLDIFKRYFKDIIIEEEEICGSNFRLKFSTKRSLKFLISFGQLFAFYNVMKYRYLTENEISKYMGRLSKIKAPYFIKYIFKVNALKDRHSFVKYKKLLEEGNDFGEVIEFKYGYAHEQRMDVVESLLSFKRSIIDFGCGNGEFAKRFCRRLEKMAIGKMYYAIDKDEEMLTIAKRRVKETENIIFGTSFPDIDDEGRDLEYFDVIMSEVIEHMDKNEATNVVKEILGKKNVKSIIITTPNKDFNQFFSFQEDEMRYEDHKFEMGKEEFVRWIEDIIRGNGKINNGKIENNKKELNIQFLDIGDKVNSISMTSGVMIEKVEYAE